jgi:steroid delta-isomerase
VNARRPPGAAPALRPAPPVEALCAWYETLTPATLGRLGEFYRADASFEDPFNEVTGLIAIERIFADMFERTGAPRFIVRETLAGTDRAFLAWDFECTLRGRRLRVHGCTRLAFDEQGRVRAHRDYWDPAGQLWRHLPLLGPCVAWLRRRMAAAPATRTGERR